MVSDTKRRIEEYKAMLPGIRERVVAVALMLAMSIAMLTSTSYAWLTISRSPEAKGMTTTITGNGNLEIALAPSNGEVPLNADGSSSDLTQTNITWGNLVNLSDARYGLDQIALRPALLSQYNLTTSPLYGATYGEDGRVTGTSDKYSFASFATAEDGTTYFAATSAANPNYGVRAITSITYMNVSGNAALNSLQTRISNAYGSAVQKYKAMIGTGDGSDSTIIYGEGATAVRAIPALQMLMELYVQDKAQNLLGSYTQDYSGVVTYAYYLLAAFQDILESEGEALTSLANMQIYKTNNDLGTGYYASFEEFYNAYTAGTLHSAVALESLTTFFANYKAIADALADDESKTNDLYDLAIACDPNTVSEANRPAVTWAELSPYVGKLVDIGTVTIEHGSDKVTIGKLSKSDAGALLGLAGNATQSNPATATISKGALMDTEARLGAYLRESGVVVCVNVNYMGVEEVYSYVVTNVDPQQMTLSGKDQQTVENMSNEGAEDMGEAVANDTYGMAIDLWVRTNVSDVVLTLEGSLVTTEVAATTINKNGEETTLYLMTVSTTTTSTVYGITDGGVTTYYSYDTETGAMSQVGDSDSMLSIMGYEFSATGNTLTVDGVTYTEYTMKQNLSTNTDVYVLEDVARWYLEDGTLVGAVDTLADDTRYAFAETEQTITVDGQNLAVYTMTYKDSATGDVVEASAYQITEDIWYRADNHEELGTDAQLREEGAAFTEQTEEWVTGYDGVNRIWEDYLTQIENGFMLENNTTQGAGSCYVFYADPSDQTRILNLLEAFTVVFMDNEGNKLGTAKLDTEHYYSINGKTTVPLKLIAGTTYFDENGDEQYGITALEKNEATWISAVIYLDGTRLTNADVLAVGEIEGTLNLQFGSSVSLHNQDDTDLRFQFRDLEAVASYGNMTSASSSQPISLEYDENGHEVTVTLTVDGTQPSTIQGFFIRSISKTQGTKGQTVAFTNQGGGVWTATFKLTTPGTYVMRSLIVDGAEYALDDGTETAENGVVVDSFPSVEITGLGIASVRVDGVNKGITMTADHSVAAEVTVGIDADASLMPKQVRALFRSASGREFTALLTNTGSVMEGSSTSVWKGTANITESGEYTLQYVVMDGVFFDLTEIWESQGEQDPTQGQFTYIIYLGLTAKVWTTSETQFEYQGPTDISFQVKIYDGTGEEIHGLEDVWLYYHSEGSVLDQDGMYGQIRWDGSEYYVGTLQVSAGGTFLFDRVVTNRANESSRSTITNASTSPVITAIVTDPPQYISNTTTSYQFVPDGGATMSVVLQDAQTASVWALITNGTDTYMVALSAKNNYSDYYEYTFEIPADDTQDGQWQMIALYLQGCADNNEEWVPKTTSPVSDGFIKLNAAEDGTWVIDGTEDTVNPGAYFIFDLTDQGVESYVVETIYISVNGAESVESSKVTFGNVGFGFDDTNKNGLLDSGETITGTFMQSHTTEDVTFVITDWNGKVLDATVNWTSAYDHNSSAYGGYTTDQLFESNQVELDKSNGVHTLAGQTYQLAGTHSTKFTIQIDGKTVVSITGDFISVYSNAPTVTISSVSPAPGTTIIVNCADNPVANDAFTAMTGDFNYLSADGYFATAYINYTEEWALVTYYNGSLPTVGLTLSNISGNFTNATLTFDNDANSTYAKTYTFTPTGLTQTSKIGGIVTETGTDNEIYPAGKQTVSQMTVVVDGVTYTVQLSHEVTINQPQYPPYATFNSTASGQTLPTTPSTIYGTPNADGTFTITLPGSQTWTEAKSSTTNGDFVQQSQTTRNVYTERSETTGSGCNTTTTTYYTPYIETTTVSKATSSTTTWTRTWTITGWKVGNTTYAVGETITIEGHQTFTPVLSYSDGSKTTESSTTTRTVIAYTQNGDETTTVPDGSKVDSVVGSTTDVVS